LRNVTLALLLAAFPLAAGASVTVAALGDSLTAGYGLPQEQGFTAQLQAWLRAKGQDVTISNAGVSGDTSAGALSRLNWTLSPSVKAVILNIGANDMLRGTDPGATAKNIDAILKETTRQHIPVLLVGIKSSGNFGPDYKARFDAIYPDLAARYHTLFFPDYFGPFLAVNPDPAAMGQFLQDDHLHPNAKGVTTIVDSLGPQVLDLLKEIQ
jgi:acyl-CoA thioesterase-1